MTRPPLPSLDPLPIDPYLDVILRHVRGARAAVIVAAPGAGKTTRVPPAVAVDGPAIVLQPRRVAARAIAARIAEERGWTLGEDVGWHVRFERRFSARTRVLLATEGILTARLLHDPLLSDFRTIVLDEFHERSVHADVGLALARQAWRARDDLRIVVMSATIDPRPVARFLDDCPVIEVPGRTHPVTIDYAPGQPLVRAIDAMLARTTHADPHGDANPDADTNRDARRDENAEANADANADASARLAGAARGAAGTGASGGTILCFLPGAPEIRREMTALAHARPDLDILPLHGSLSADEQDRAIRAPGLDVSPDGARRAAAARGPRRRVILTTNIAETSLTVPGVTAVIDTGLQKVARYDTARGIDSLEVERISQDSADQRAGRAGRLGPGVARRLWHAHDRLRPQREPDIARIDLAATLLDLLAWGGDPDRFEWFEAPPDAATDAAWTLLRRLGAVDGRALTPMGRALQRLPVHPRLGRILLESGGSRDAARACALLAERHYIAPRHEATTCDLLIAIDHWDEVPWHVQRVARDLADLAARAAHGGDAQRPSSSGPAVASRNAVRDAGVARHGQTQHPSSPARSTAAPLPPATASHNAGRDLDAARRGEAQRPSSPVRSTAASTPSATASDSPGRDTRADAADASALRRAIFTGYADRVARRRAPGSPRVVLSSGHGATIAAESGVQDGELLVALDVQAASGRDATEARIRIASLVDRAWLVPTDRLVVHWFDADAGRVKAARRELYDALVLAEHPVDPDPDEAARVLAEAYLARGLRDVDQQLIRRLRFADRTIDPAALVARAAPHARTLDDVDLAAHVTHDEARDLARLAPDVLRVPSGRTARLEYHEDGSVSAAVKLQELFGLADTPRIGARQTPVLLQLLAPNGRPVQTTRDLRSFWDRTYPEVRKELRGRYPRHPWPDDPWSATPTARAKPRR